MKKLTLEDRRNKAEKEYDDAVDEWNRLDRIYRDCHDRVERKIFRKAVGIAQDIMRELGSVCEMIHEEEWVEEEKELNQAYEKLDIAKKMK